MARRKPEILIADIVGSLGKISAYLSGFSRDGFLADDKTIDAVVRNLEIIGEAVKNLPHEWKEEHSDIQWSPIAGLRNRIVHDYAGIDLELIWEITQTALPELSRQLRDIERS